MGDLLRVLFARLQAAALLGLVDGNVTLGGVAPPRDSAPEMSDRHGIIRDLP